MAPSDPQQLLEDFIHCYRSHSVLWDVTNKKYYHNKLSKRAAYEELLKVLRKYRKNACLADVKRKINTLRCTYRKELNKIRQSKSSGAGLEEVYVPSLWWFKSMQFLGQMKVRKPAPPISTVSDSIKNEDASCNERVRSPTPNKEEDNRKELSRIAREYLAKDKTQKIYKDEDQFFNTARTWANKLRSLSHERQLIIEKKINDIIFEAQMAELFKEEESIRRGEESESPEFSEDETSYIQSEDNSHFQPEAEGLDIKIEEQSLHEEEEPTIEGINSGNHSRSPSPPVPKFAKIDDGPPVTKQPLTISEHLKSCVPLISLPSSSNHAQNKFHSLPAFKAPASSGHKMNSRQFRKSSIINPVPKPRIDPIIRTRQFVQLEERISSLQRSVDSLKKENDDEFDLFGKSIALQLKNMPLERAFICQENLQKIINQERLHQSNLSLNGNGFTS